MILEDVAANAKNSEAGLVNTSSNEEIVNEKSDTPMLDKPCSPSDGEVDSVDQREGDDATNVEQHEVVVAEKSADVAIKDKPTPSSNGEINGMDRKEESEEIKRMCWFGMNCFRPSCSFVHTNNPSPPKCRFGMRCAWDHCLYKHNNDCSNRWDCNEENCNKRHVIPKTLEEHSSLQARKVNKSNSPQKMEGRNDTAVYDQQKQGPVKKNIGYGNVHSVSGLGNQVYYSYDETNQNNVKSQGRCWYDLRSECEYQYQYYPGQIVYPVKRLNGNSKNWVCRS